MATYITKFGAFITLYKQVRPLMNFIFHLVIKKRSQIKYIYVLSSRTEIACQYVVLQDLDMSKHLHNHERQGVK